MAEGHHNTSFVSNIEDGGSVPTALYTHPVWIRRGRRPRDVGRKEHTVYHERKGEEQEEHASAHRWMHLHALFWATACLLCAVTFEICQLFFVSLPLQLQQNIFRVAEQMQPAD